MLTIHADAACGWKTVKLAYTIDSIFSVPGIGHSHRPGRTVHVLTAKPYKLY